jgi:hypothetical protein
VGCTEAYASAWQYASFWCRSTIITGDDNSGGAPGHAALGDTEVNFVDMGVKAGVGMTLYNLTAGTSGPITAVATHSLTATGVTWDDGDLYRVVTLEADTIGEIELYLDITASDIHAALAASGACDCTLSSWGAQYLAKLNIVDAAVFHHCPCLSPNLSEERQIALMDWVSAQLLNIRNGNIPLCDGETGAEFPAVGWAEQSVTEFNVERIIENDILRNL